MRNVWLGGLLALLALPSCDEGSGKERPGPTVNVDSSGAGGMGGPGAGGDGQIPLGPEGGAAPALPTPLCNGWPQLCARPYDRVAYPVAHAAMANSASFWTYPAQDKNLRAQLDDSIRGLMLEVHDQEGVPTLCFDDCAEGQASLVTELARVAAFLADNPRDVVTLLIDNRVPAADVGKALDDAELAPYLYRGDSSQPWPTLGELIDEDQRLVVFLADSTDAPAGYLSLPDNVRATSGSGQAARDLDCATGSGSPDAPLVLLMQTLATPLDGSDGAAGAGGTGAASPGRPSAELAQTVNHDPLFSERVALCSDVWGRAPTFVAVDFYDQSDVIGVTQRASKLLP